MLTGAGERIAPWQVCVHTGEVSPEFAYQVASFGVGLPLSGAKLRGGWDR